MENKTWNAMDYLDDDLLSAAVADMERPAPGKYAPWIRGMAIAASVAVVVSGGVYLGVRYWDGGGAAVSTVPRGEILFAASSGSAPVERMGQFGTYYSEKNQFPIDDVTLTFYFGISLPEVERNLDYYDVPKLTLYFGKYVYFGKEIGENDYFVKVREYNVNFLSGEYYYETLHYENDKYYRKYHHSEELTIPPEMFTKEASQMDSEKEGGFFLTVYGENKAIHADRSTQIVIAIEVDYSIENGVVTIKMPNYVYSSGC